MNNDVQTLHKNLARLDHLSLNDLANFFEDQAEICRHEAVKSATSDLEKQAAGINYLVNAPRLIMRHLKQGHRLNDALKSTSEELKVPLSSIQRTWERFTHDKSIYELKRRNRLIIELAALGFSNSDIGKKVNLHPNSVSRIISKVRKDYYTARSANSDNVNMLLAGGIQHNQNPLID